MSSQNAPKKYRNKRKFSELTKFGLMANRDMLGDLTHYREVEEREE